MRSKLLIASACLAALSLAACNNAAGDTKAAGDAAVNKAEDTAAAAVGVGTGAAGAVNTEGFIRDAAIAGMYEIESSKLALQRSTNAAVKQAAQKIIDDHTAADAKLKALAASKGWTLPTAMDDRRMGLLANLKAASAADFDDVYLDQQTAAHHEALALFNGYREAGPDAELKAFAAEVAPKLEMHAELVTSLDRDSAADDGAAKK